ncbi:hypothetical protein, partial [Pedobacter ghigonis]|uniref:hypothetical protein n=1 Tax=Pedobacter ghigonis TaxID=2730403 RepID=UPI001C37CC28
GGKRSKLLEQPLKMNCPNEASLELPWTTKLKINLDINTESPWLNIHHDKIIQLSLFHHPCSIIHFLFFKMLLLN